MTDEPSGTCVACTRCGGAATYRVDALPMEVFVVYAAWEVAKRDGRVPLTKPVRVPRLMACEAHRQDAADELTDLYGGALSGPLDAQ